MAWFGADPGGAGCFGMAKLNDDRSFSSACVSGVEEAIQWIDDKPEAIGIDCPMWWSSSRSGDRLVDKRLRRQYKISSGTIQAVNSLRGAAIVQGPMLTLRLIEKYGKILVTEVHPKALLVVQKLANATWAEVSEQYELRGNQPKTEHERDALICAVAAQYGFLGRWKIDLSETRNADELDPKSNWFGSVSYFWPESIP